MKVSPVSADLLIKLAMLGAGIAALVWAAKKVATAGGDALDAAATGFNPASDQNYAYSGANAAVRAITGTDATLGTWIYDKTHPAANKVPDAAISSTESEENRYDPMGNVIY